MSTDLTFITNESGKSLHDRFGVLLSDDTASSIASSATSSLATQLVQLP